LGHLFSNGLEQYPIFVHLPVLFEKKKKKEKRKHIQIATTSIRGRRIEKMQWKKGID